jgi:hypothetical protein
MMSVKCILVKIALRVLQTRTARTQMAVKEPQSDQARVEASILYIILPPRRRGSARDYFDFGNFLMETF